MTIYADVVFLMNFLIDYGLLLLTGRICRQPLYKMRLFLSSFLGAAYTLFLFFPPLSFAYTFLSKCLFSCAMILIAFRWVRIRHFFQLLLVFYAVSLFIAGGLFAVHYLMQDKTEIINGILTTTHASSMPVSGPTLLLLLIGFPLFWWLARFGYFSMKANRQTDVQYVQVEVEVNGCSITCTGFIDTGNQLYDPISRTPVTIMDMNLWKEVLPPSFPDEQKIEQSILEGEIYALEGGWTERVRLIPYKTVSSQMSIMLAIRPDKVCILAGEKKYETSKMLIGLRTGMVSSDGSYQAIVHPRALEETRALVS
ncbi:sigma-E processing peptidase SpoIIGA [Aneurinibacillus tyrosinisolvens]|uniref:sigma-E processing peptidase SpoIIGA n=1 Tax=Aneurinibacillus tyrosinisolvens TaxID=1443435 RepID=UPI00063F6575|nr:sigma-E processing peptidase SpoIIGA [Aneurinibacillus tyrosinisolvens]